MIVGRSGSVLLFSLMVMGMVTLLTQQLVKSVSVGIAFSSTMVAREQAEMLALGGISVAMAQLQKGMLPPKKEAKAPEGAQAAERFNFASFIREILPVLGRWQTFALREECDGIEGQLQLCITCEEGKLPVAALYDEQKGDCSASTKELFKSFSIKKKVPEGALLAKCTAFFKKRSTRVSDVSAFAPVANELHLPIFYEPIAEKTKQKGAAIDEEVVRDIALQDLCTTWRAEAKLSPLVLTDAVCAVLKLRRPQAADQLKRKTNFEELAKNYADALTKGNEIVWKTLQSLYEVKPKLSTEISNLFLPEIEPRLFSVLSCGTVAGVKQTVLAVIERVQKGKEAIQGDKKAQPVEKKGAPKETRPQFKIRRLYWI